MIKLSKSVEYSLLALKYISDNEKSENLSSRKISDDLKIPYELLSKLLQKLVKEGIIKSQQGKFGGYSIAIPLEKLTILKIIDSLGENVQLSNCTVPNATETNCGRLNSCSIKTPFWNLQNKIISIFENTTLHELTT